ncbi:MAG: hypothetical protein WD184_05240 [Acidimicrobiia bacterium]
MSRVRRVLVAFAMIIVALPVLTGAGGQGDAARSEHQRIIDFWTPERVAQAVPRDFYFEPASGRYKLAKPPGTPGGGPGGGGGDGTTVTGASWNGGGTVADTTGKVLFALGTSYYVCSASLVVDGRSGESLVLTAGHCVYDNATGGVGFATNWMFIPNYDASPAALTTDGSFCSGTLYGCWTAEALVVHSGFATAGGFNEQAIVHDFAFAVLGDGGHNGSTLAESLGTQDIVFTDVASGTKVYAFGYPHASPYDGTDLVYCAGGVGFDTQLSNQTYKLGCDMTGGASGGPWFKDFVESDGEGILISVNSYKYRNDKKSMYGPKFNSDTQDVYSAAGTATGNTVVP